MSLWNIITRFIDGALGFNQKASEEALSVERFDEARWDRERRLRIIRRRQSELKAEIATARTRKKARKHLYAEQAKLTNEALRLEGVK